jgi:hypothetical protein
VLVLNVGYNESAEGYSQGIDTIEGSGLKFDDRGAHELKGIDGARLLYAVR